MILKVASCSKGPVILVVFGGGPIDMTNEKNSSYIFLLFLIICACVSLTEPHQLEQSSGPDIQGNQEVQLWPKLSLVMCLPLVEWSTPRTLLISLIKLPKRVSTSFVGIDFSYFSFLKICK